jgi:hypothetical protein
VEVITVRVYKDDY